jgi:hypothetical protein
MGLGIIIPVVVIAIGVPLALAWANKTFKGGSSAPDSDVVSAPAARLTSNALRTLATPPWRVVYEIGADKLGDVEHVVIGPPGVFAVQTSMDPLPTTVEPEPEPHDVAQAAIVRGSLDDALTRCAMSSDRLVRVHWGAGAGGAVEVLPGLTAVAGGSLSEWIDSLAEQSLSPAQVDLAWQTVLTSIGRPDPLA